MTLTARIAVFILGVGATNLIAQTFGEITGNVLDSSGSVLPGAVVTVTNPATTQIRKVTANDAGNYMVPFLVPGLYDVQAESRGFRSSTRKSVELQVGATARIDFALQVGDLAQEVTISGGVPLLQTENSTLGTVVETKRIVELPLNGRNYTQLIALSPNVSAEMQAGGKGPQRQGGERTSQTFSIAGQRLVFNHFTLDGAENTDVNFNTFIIRPSIDALQEFKVQTGVYSAEFGRETAQVNVTTKPGTNHFHGALFEFLRNDALDAREWGQVGAKNPFRRNQFGFTLDGRIIPNKLFFMSNFEETQERKTLLGTANVPTARMRNGDFSGQRLIYDPLTRVFGSDANGNLKALSALPFPNNTIPANRFNPIAIQLLEFYPLPNQNKGDNILSNYIRDRARPIAWEQFVQRIDWNQGAKSTWFGRFSWGDEYVKNISSFATQEGYNATKVYQGLLANTRVFGPSVVNEFRFAYNQFQNDQLPYFANKRNVTGELGIVGSPLLPAVAWGAPFMQFQNGLTNFGQDGNGPFLNRNHTFQWIDNVSVVRGKHSLKFGGEIRRDRYNQYGNEHDRGSYQFQSNATPDPANRAATGHSFADYLLGQVYFTAQTLGLADSLYRATSLSGYAEDTWKITQRLTMNIGLRYEYVPPFVDKYRGMANLQMFGVLNRDRVPILTRPGSGDFYEGMSFHFDDSIPVQAGDQYLGRALVHDDKTNFGPRLGISYSPGRHWVIRTGIGVFYAQDSTNPEFDKARNVVGYRQFYSSDQQPNSSLSNPFANQPGRCSNWSGPCLFGPSILASFTDRRTPYSTQWMFNMQRQITEDISVEAGYIGNEGHHLQIQDTWNIAPTRTGPNDTSTIDQRKPWQQYAIIYGVNGNVNANYHGASLKLQQRLHQGLTYMVGFTWSKAIDLGSGIRRNDGDGAGPNPYNRGADRALAQYDQRRRLVASSLYELPFGKGKQFANGSALIDKFVGGWQLSGILTFADGSPWGVGGIGDLNATSLNNVPNATGISPVPANRSASNFWNIAAFDPLNPTLTYLYGNIGRNVLSAPGTRIWDASLIKNTRVREGHELQLRFEAFNTTNHPNWNTPATDTRTPATFGKITTAKTMRDLQFGLKYIF